ncbi:MAG: hypothetical protein IT480_14865 [Gammaproteobacteria bacterium]|nr:hypothetical protein [Gammaproteobacteria bacterium]
MQRPSAASVLGNFDDITVRTASTGITRLMRHGDRYTIHTAGPDGQIADYDVQYTFGVDPLQQYLLALPGGRLQAFTLAWDTQAHRWYDLSPDVAGPGDALHWTGAYYNWNYMCADCHSTGVRKNYDAGSATFATTYAVLNVACQACHGPASRHLQRARAAASGALNAPYGFDPDPMRQGAAAQIDGCARCHARRATLGTDPGPQAPLLDTYVPSLIEDPLYYDDGQIRDEVYEYGSFLQSRMHERGVRCSDCHEPHTLQTQAPGDALCTRCHNSGTPALPHAIDSSGLQRRDYTSRQHHFHAPDTPGSHCVDCHMPTRTYMGVDARHDHSLRIPRPDLSVRLGTPNACNNCHRDRSAGWAADAVTRWWGPARRHEDTYAVALQAGRRREPGGLRALQALLRDTTIPAFVRASALRLLHAYPGTASGPLLAEHLADPDPLVRLQAVAGYEQLAPAERITHLAPRLLDPIRAVRIEAARLLATAPPQQFSTQAAEALRRGLAEYVAAQEANADRPEAHLNLGNLYADQGEAARARQEYAAALRLDARFVAAYANHADLEAASGDLDAAARALRAGLQRVPDAAQLHHALGLVLIRQGDRSAALAELRRATQLAPDDARFAYVHGVAVHDLVGPDRGRALLKAALARSPNDHDLLQALASYAQAEGDAATAHRYLLRLRSIEDPLEPVKP